MGELSDDITPPAFGEGAPHASRADPLDETEIDAVVDSPCLEQFLEHDQDFSPSVGMETEKNSSRCFSSSTELRYSRTTSRGFPANIAESLRS